MKSEAARKVVCVRRTYVTRPPSSQYAAQASSWGRVPGFLGVFEHDWCVYRVAWFSRCSNCATGFTAFVVNNACASLSHSSPSCVLRAGSPRYRQAAARRNTRRVWCRGRNRLHCLPDR